VKDLEILVNPATRGDPMFPLTVSLHDFPDPQIGKAAPFGIYDLTRKEGFVNVGIDHDTAQFAVESIRLWWKEMGMKAYPEAEELLITADCGGSNGYRTHLWHAELQKFATEAGLTISVSHFPPGTSKWNKIEHQMFSQITKNWGGQPLVSYAVVVNMIAGTTTKSGLKIMSQLDKRQYANGIKVPKEIYKGIKIVRADFHGEWNYKFHPNRE
jgi:hypothetical protein